MALLQTAAIFSLTEEFSIKYNKTKGITASAFIKNGRLAKTHTGNPMAAAYTLMSPHRDCPSTIGLLSIAYLSVPPAVDCSIYALAVLNTTACVDYLGI